MREEVLVGVAQLPTKGIKPLRSGMAGAGDFSISARALAPCLEEEERVAPSQRATSALAAHMDAYGPAVNDLKSLGTQKCIFGVDGPI